MTNAASPIVPLPNGWVEINYPNNPANPNDPTGAPVDEALDFLKATHPLRYPNVTYARLRKKTQPRSGQANGVRSVRIFVHRAANNTLDMCAFFFLRLKNQTAWCLTVGVASGINPNVLDADVRQVCRHLRSLPGPPGIDVINAAPLPADLISGPGNTPMSNIVGMAFQSAQNAGVFTLTYPFSLPFPWPPTVYRYKVATPIP